MSFVVKAAGVRNSTKMGKQIEKTIGDNNEEDSSGAEDAGADDSDFELKDKCQAMYVDFLELTSLIDFNTSVQYREMQSRFRKTLFLSIFAPPPNTV